MRAILGFLLLLAPQVFAGPFDPVPTDESVTILGYVFGGLVGDLYLGGQINPIFSELIEKLNFIMISGGACIVSYVSILSIIHTAHEGEALGHSRTKWSLFWIPLRSIVGMSLMVPTPATGYSLIQVAVMWVVLQGIGVADIMWQITLQSMLNGVSAVGGTITDPTLQPTGAAMVQDLLNAEICMQSVQALFNPQGNSYVYTNAPTIHSFAQQTNAQTASGAQAYIFGSDNQGPYVTINGNMYFGFNSAALPQPDAQEVCGSIAVSATVHLQDYPKSIQQQFNNTTQSQQQLINYLGQEAETIYQTKLNAYTAMLGVLQPLAQGYVTGEYLPPGPTTMNPAPPGYTSAAANAYAQLMGALVIPLSAYSSGQFISLATNASATQGAQQGALAGGAAGAYGGFLAGGIGGAIVGGLVGAGAGAAVGSTQANTVVNTITLLTHSLTDFSWTTIDAINSGLNVGWISAASFYFILNEAMLSEIFPSAREPYQAGNFNIPSCDDPASSCLVAMQKYNVGVPDNAPVLNANLNPGQDQTTVAQYLSYGYDYVLQDQAPVGGFNLSNSSASSIVADMLSDITELTNIVLNVMSTIFSGSATNSDPLLTHAKFGATIMRACEAVWVKVMSKMLKNTLKTSTNITKNIYYLALTATIWGLVAIFIPVLAFLWMWGAILAIYCPLIPYMFFILGALGWLILVAEAIISAPIIAVGLVTPGGEEFGSSTHTALVILTNIFLRPVLMIFGFLLAGKIYKAIVSLIDTGIGAVYMSLNIYTLFSIVVVIGVYASFILSTTNICFALIYELPNKIMRWLGGHQEEIELGDLAKIKGAAQAAGHEVGKMTQETAGKGVENIQKQIAKAKSGTLRGGGPSAGGGTP